VASNGHCYAFRYPSTREAKPDDNSQSAFRCGGTRKGRQGTVQGVPAIAVPKHSAAFTVEYKPILVLGRRCFNLLLGYLTDR